ELAVSPHDQPALGLDLQRDALLLGDRFVELGEASSRFADVERLKPLDVRAGFGARNQEERVEDLDQAVGLLNRLFERGPIGAGVTAERERSLGVIAQTC